VKKGDGKKTIVTQRKAHENGWTFGRGLGIGGRGGDQKKKKGSGAVQPRGAPPKKEGEKVAVCVRIARKGGEKNR